jgi:hypothetical protein
MTTEDKLLEEAVILQSELDKKALSEIRARRIRFFRLYPK